MLFLLVLIAVSLARAEPPVSFQSHYIPYGSSDTPASIAADTAGNLFIISKTIDAQNRSSIRVTKTDPDGTFLVARDFAQGITPSAATVDAAGNLFVAGNNFIAELDNTLTTVLATTSLASDPTLTTITAIKVSPSGNVYAVGMTSAPDFPTTRGSYLPNPPSGPTYAFVAELEPNLSKVISATLFGNPKASCRPSTGCNPQAVPSLARTTAYDLAIEASGAILIAGETDGQDGPLPATGNHGFIARFSPDLQTLVARLNPSLSFSGRDFPPAHLFSSMAVDGQGNVIIASGAGFDDFSATSGRVSLNWLNAYGAAVMEFSPDLQTLIWGTYFGDSVAGLTVDSKGNVWITGTARSQNFPPVQAYEATTLVEQFSRLAYVAQLSPDGSQVLNWSFSQFGGTGIVTLPSGGIAALSARDSFVLTGPPDAPSLLMVANAANSISTGTIAPVELLSLFGTGIGPTTPNQGQIVDGVYTKSLAGYQVLFDGIAAPILYAAADQINVLSPASIADRQSVTIEIVGPTQTIALPTVYVAAVQPQIFSQQLPAKGELGLTRQVYLLDYAFVKYDADPAWTAEKTSFICTIWANGTGLPDSPLPDGSIASSTTSVNLPVTISGDGTFEVLHAGPAPGAVVGVTQITFRIFGPAPPFNRRMQLQINGVTTLPARFP